MTNSQSQLDSRFKQFVDIVCTARRLCFADNLLTSDDCDGTGLDSLVR